MANQQLTREGDEFVVDRGSSSEAANLEGLFLEFGRKLLDAARSDVAHRGMPKRAEHLFRFHQPKFIGPAASGSTTSFGTVEKLDFIGLLFLNWQLWAAGEANLCAQEHFERGIRRDRKIFDETWQPITKPTFGKARNAFGEQLTYELYSAIVNLCERVQTLNPTEAQVREAYQGLLEEWASPTVVWGLWAPLVNFKCEHFPLRIAQNLELAALTHEEKTKLWNPNGVAGPFAEPPGLDRANMARAEFALRATSTTGRDDAGFGQEFGKDVVRAVTALRLLGVGDVGAPVILGVNNGLFERYASQYVFDGRSRTPGRIYELRAADWDSVMNVYDALGVIEGRMQISLRRFNQAYGRQLGEDSIIDLTIALEGCLLPETRDELQYRLSMRGAALVAGLRNPLETQALLKTMYEVRSEIVHNGKLVADEGVRRKVERLGPVVAKDFLHACEDVVRDILRECVLRLAVGGTLRTLSEEIDTKVLSGLLPLA
ncbi:MAG: hypothetical protein ACREQR_13515 [Candidatus Binataceae bacterium]